MLRVALTALLLAAAPAVAHPAGLPCKLAHKDRLQFYDHLEYMPVWIRDAVRAHFAGGIAYAGEPYNATDDVPPGLPMHRVVRGGRRDDHYFVWVDHDGRGRHIHVLGLILFDTGERYAHPVYARLTADLVGDPCRATDAFLDGVESSPAVG